MKKGNQWKIELDKLSLCSCFCNSVTEKSRKSKAGLSVLDTYTVIFPQLNWADSDDEAGCSNLLDNTFFHPVENIWSSQAWVIILMVMAIHRVSFCSTNAAGEEGWDQRQEFSAASRLFNICWGQNGSHGKWALKEFACACGQLK